MRIVSLFRNEATDKTELGLWYEIVEPLTSACGIPYRSEMGWKWDWHIIPGYSVAYTRAQRERMIDEAMRKFREVFGCYPRSIGGWVIDTHTLNYLAEHYDIAAAAICRDQANTDAYTLSGGYFNQAYYPSRNNIFTPAQSPAMQTPVPVFRLLGPCPIHNFDKNKYSSDALRAIDSNCFTLEPCWHMGSTPDAVKWMFDSYYGQESLGFAYAQTGQENSFHYARQQVLGGLRMQIEQLLARGDVSFQKMGDTGALFRQQYPVETPATSVVALDNFDSEDVQSVYYDCKHYTANLFRFEDRIFLRSLFLFDERIEDLYLNDTCTTFDAVYENLPMIDTMACPDEEKKQCGLMIAAENESFTAKKIADGTLQVSFGRRIVVFRDDRIEIMTDALCWYRNSIRANVTVSGNSLLFEYKGHPYRVDVEGARIIEHDATIDLIPANEKVTIYPRKC